MTMQEQQQQFQEHLVNIHSSTDDKVSAANEMMTLILNRAVMFNHSKYPNIILDAYTEDSRSSLLYKIADIVGTVTNLNFYINKEAYDTLHTSTSAEYVSMLGGRAYRGRVVEPNEDELVWTDQDIEVGAVDRVIPIFRGVPNSIIDFIMGTLYKGE